jgi:phospholipase C
MDDFGGFYDSAPPPANPDSTQEGIRLPLIAVSPWAVPQGTDSAPASFASLLRFTETTFGLPALEANDASAYDLSGMFSFTGAARLGHKVRMVTRPVPAGDRIGWAQARQGS